MYCTQTKIGNPLKPILIIISSSLVLVLTVLLFLYTRTNNVSKKNNMNNQSSMLNFSIIEDSAFIGFINETPIIQKDNTLYKYNSEHREYDLLLEIPVNSMVQVSDNYIAVINENTHTSTNDIYNYYEQIAIYESNSKFLYEITNEFSVILLHDKQLFTVKFNKIQSSDQDISTIKTYSLSDNNYSLENEFTLPYEVVPKIINNIIFYQTVEYREQVLYEVKDDIVKTNEMLSQDLLLINNELCYFSYEQEPPIIKCNEKTYSLDFSPVALYQSNGTIYLVKDSSTEEIKSYETTIAEIEENIQVIELSIPFSPFEFECRNKLCVLWSTTTTMFISN